MRYPLNVPIDIVRTVVAVSDSGSMSKAGERLGLSQPAVSSQMKRIQNLVGGELFRKTPNGSVATELGKLVLQQARRMLEANDQMLRFAGDARTPQTVRIGITNLYVQEFIKTQKHTPLQDIVIQTDSSTGIAKGMIDGYIDVACIFDGPDAQEIAFTVVDEAEVELVWVRSKGFVVSPGAPIPLLIWPGHAIDDLMIKTLTRRNIQYRAALTTSDYHAKICAAEVGLGLTVLPRQMIPASLVEANEYYLPKLPGLKMLLCVRPQVESPNVTEAISALSALFFRTNEPASR
jgi:DNA-binding transcriptional LysR family regulator